MRKYIELTKTDREILQSYKQFLDGLSSYLGDGYEIILHSLEDIDQSAIKVINGHYSGRSEGAPITDLAMEMLVNIQKNEEYHNGKVYSNRSAKGTPLRSATIPVYGENNNIIGLVCFNFYMDMPLYSFIDSFIKFPKSSDEVVETFVSNSSQLLADSVENAKRRVRCDPTINISNFNREIITILYEKNIFQMKDSVSQVAELLGISKNTVYMHLRNLNSEKEV